MKITLSNFPMVDDGLNARDIVELARTADKAGVDRFGIADWLFHEECVALMSGCLVATEKLELESLVTSPYRRAPDVTAAMWATMSEMSGGRAILGVGRGGGNAETWVSPWGFERPNGLAAVEEFLDICKLMYEGGTPPAEGKILHTSGKPLLFDLNYKIPLLVAARGTKMLALAAQKADIVHLALPLIDIDFVNANVKLVHEAAIAAGRDPSELEIDVTFGISIAEDHDVARNTAKAIAAVALIWSSQDSARATLNFDVPENLMEKLRTDWNPWENGPMPKDIADLMSDELVDHYVVAGTVEECGLRLKNLLDELPGITGVRLKSPRVFGDAPLKQYQEIASLTGALHQYI